METLSWGRLESHIKGGSPALLEMGGTRRALIGFDPAGPRLFLRLPLESGAQIPPSPYAELGLEERRDGQTPVLEVFTASTRLFMEFHRFAGLITEEYEVESQTAAGALTAVIRRWQELTTERAVLSPEQQLGLFGELVVLQALIRKYGPSAVSSWTGRMPELPERHDFRLGTIDLEVKATRSSRRRHVIHGLRQLEASDGHSLVLMSIKVEAAGMGQGRSLVDRVTAIRELLKSDDKWLSTFEGRLRAANYQDVDAAHYQDRLIFAEAPMLIPVDDNSPRLIRKTIQVAVGLDLASRIDNDATYRIDVEGLGESLITSSQADLFGASYVE